MNKNHCLLSSLHNKYETRNTYIHEALCKFVNVFFFYFANNFILKTYASIKTKAMVTNTSNKDSLF